MGELEHAVNKALQIQKNQLLLIERTLQSMNPLATLDRGYAIVTRKNGGIVTDASTTPPGTSIDVQFARGELSATVDDNK
jgi:exodeoxyribonuclease VII large subunit